MLHFVSCNRSDFSSPASAKCESSSNCCTNLLKLSLMSSVVMPKVCHKRKPPYGGVSLYVLRTTFCALAHRHQLHHITLCPRHFKMRAAFEQLRHCFQALGLHNRVAADVVALLLAAACRDLRIFASRRADVGKHCLIDLHPFPPFCHSLLLLL